jgi:hypothetical protein
VACKTGKRDAAGAKEELERSLKLMQTDHFDLYQLHAMSSLEDFEKVTAPHHLIISSHHLIIIILSSGDGARRRHGGLPPGAGPPPPRGRSPGRARRSDKREGR